MSEKLTEQKIDEMIQELLQEKYSKKFSNADVPNFKDLKTKLGIPKADKYPKGAASARTDTIALRDLDTSPKDTLDLDDFIYAAQNIPGNEDAMDAASWIARNTSDKSIKDIMEPATLGDITKLKPAQDYKPKGIAFQQMANIGAELSGGKNRGQFHGGLGAAVDSMFVGLSTFQERIAALSEFTRKVAEKNVAGMKKTELLSSALVADYVTTIAREIDSGSGAYQIEVLTAMLAGGRVTGKATGQGKKQGQMGAVDFVMNDGTKGSSKYYSNITSGKISQAISGFSGTAPVLYVIIHKQAEGTKFTTKGTGESSPTKVYNLNVYLAAVTPTTAKPTKAKDFEISINGKKGVKATALPSDAGQLNISAALSTASPFQIQVHYGGKAGDTFRKQLAAATKGTNLDNVRKAFDKFFTKTYESNELAKEYASTKNKNIGNKALVEMAAADQAFRDMAAELSGKALKGRTIQEEALKKEIFESLDDLIAETIRDVKKKTKK